MLQLFFLLLARLRHRPKSSDETSTEVQDFLVLLRSLDVDASENLAALGLLVDPSKLDDTGGLQARHLHLVHSTDRAAKDGEVDSSVDLVPEAGASLDTGLECSRFREELGSYGDTSGKLEVCAECMIDAEGGTEGCWDLDDLVNVAEDFATS